MSNVIRYHHGKPVETKILKTKKIEFRNIQEPEDEKDPEQQILSVKQEIAALLAQKNELENELQEKQQQAQTDIEFWWEQARTEAQAEAERLADVATAQGFETGKQQGYLQAEEDFKEKRLEMEELIREAYSEKSKIVQEAETFLLSLSVRIAERVIKEELKQHEEQLLNIVKQALKHIEEAEDINMQVSLDDYPVLLPFLEELKTYVRADCELKMIPVANVEAGGCMLHTPSGSYDVTIDSQLEEIKKHLLAYCEEKTNDEPAER
ncbi:FliH/SctL family protein [Planococcus halotolerans]|uniref:Flagellar assembly protein FliH n=1 Tax=Planococcus halotolerans TaxID=2233542 RepID=A0A365KQY5_9BACL|nr:FliH/SctL family protein [Planococcus halotolerans]QHJ69565.1 flagellar assembly protein FliH [Planococcus halotolerans]RAZ75515.1 flagellar assembly protein FliH [Planococcus halotolerans]